MQVTIRLETPDDYLEVEKMTREAFWNLYFPGCDEHYLTHIIRNHPDFISDLDFIAETDKKIVGSIIYTRSKLISEDNQAIDIVSFGPLCVHPNYQRKGIGTLLINKTKEILIEKDIPAIVIYGDPHNYCKHGFRNGIDYNVSDMEGNQPLGLLVLELQNGFFTNKKWKIKQSDVFSLDASKVEEFDKRFEYKDKAIKYSQVYWTPLSRQAFTNLNLIYAA